MKWAIANLALQVFCKAGGKPWKVRPTAERSLIIGISQSHKSRLVGNQFHIDKYFAFLVLTENSGLFQQIQVLGESPDHSAYVAALRANLKQVLESNAGVGDRNGSLPFDPLGKIPDVAIAKNHRRTPMVLQDRFEPSNSLHPSPGHRGNLINSRAA